MDYNRDISIGENKWIKWVDFNPNDDKSIFEIDDLLKPTFEFWDGLETACEVACCGIDAFEFWEEDIARASKKIDKGQLIAAFKNLRAELVKSEKTIVSSSKLNNLLDKGVFINLVDHILITLENRAAN